jgi:hypothetical protein
VETSIVRRAKLEGPTKYEPVINFKTARALGHNNPAAAARTRREALGSIYAEACERAQLLSAYLDERIGRGGIPAEYRGFGTVGLMFDCYLRSPAFEQRVSKRSQVTSTALCFRVKVRNQTSRRQN